MIKIIKSNNAHNVKNIIIKLTFAKASNVAYITRKNIVQQNVFIKRMFQNEDAISARTFTKYLILNVQKSKQKKKIKLL